MRDLHTKTPRQLPQNRVKRAPKKREPINWRPLLKGLARGTAALAIGAAVCIGGLKLYRLYCATTFLRIENIEVTPVTRLTRPQILALAGVQPGDSMFKVGLETIAERLSKNPWLEGVRVRRFFPGTLAIDLKERSPQAIVNVGCLYYLDAEGTLFKPLAEGDKLDYPLITGVSRDDLVRDPQGSREALQTALRLIGRLRGGSVFGLADVSEIHYDKGYGFTLFTVQGGIPVRLGNGGFQAKLARFARIYNQLKPQMQALEYVDLDYNDKIIVKKG